MMQITCRTYIYTKESDLFFCVFCFDSKQESTIIYGILKQKKM